jgi:hypothetical protein
MMGDDDFRPDPLQFLFTALPGTMGRAGTIAGLEIARMIPAESGNEGFVGLGDFMFANDNPTERLDVLNGNVRVRELPMTTSTSLNFVTVDMNTDLLQLRTLPTPPVDEMWFEMAC